MSFQFRELDLQGVFLVETTRWEDPRGFLQETYKRSAFRRGGILPEFVQDNYARSGKGVLRGLHFQTPPHAQGKLIRAARGLIWDVGVDLRRGSPSFGSWVGVELAEESGRMLYLPPGFAHGYVVLGDAAEVAYKTTAEYHPASDRGLRWNDPSIGIEWPVQEPVLSEKDQSLPFLGDFESPFSFGGGIEG